MHIPDLLTSLLLFLCIFPLSYDGLFPKPPLHIWNYITRVPGNLHPFKMTN